jgi:hypothetical protein
VEYRLEGGLENLHTDNLGRRTRETITELFEIGSNPVNEAK